MGTFLTSAARTEQIGNRKYRLIDNELYKDDDGYIYLVWRNFITDNFTWVNSNGYDTRCSHIHDEGCQYHQIVRVKLTEVQLKLLHLLCVRKDKTICKDIPENFLEVIDVSGKWINNLFYRMLKAADTPKTPKSIQYLYRAGVCFNLKWFLPVKNKIDLTQIYKQEWNNNNNKGTQENG